MIYSDSPKRIDMDKCRDNNKKLGNLKFCNKFVIILVTIGMVRCKIIPLQKNSDESCIYDSEYENALEKISQKAISEQQMIICAKCGANKQELAKYFDEKREQELREDDEDNGYNLSTSASLLQNHSPYANRHTQYPPRRHTTGNYMRFDNFSSAKPNPLFSPHATIPKNPFATTALQERKRNPNIVGEEEISEKNNSFSEAFSSLSTKLSTNEEKFNIDAMNSDIENAFIDTEKDE